MSYFFKRPKIRLKWENLLDSSRFFVRWWEFHVMKIPNRELLICPAPSSGSICVVAFVLDPILTFLGFGWRANPKFTQEGLFFQAPSTLRKA
jgi:hypothetical protein